MNLYELAVVETEHVLNQFSSVTSKSHAHRMACAIVDQLVAQGIIQSTIPGNLIPGGLVDD